MSPVHTATLALKIAVDDSAVAPILAAAKGSRRPFWKHLPRFAWWFLFLVIPFNLAAGIAEAVTGNGKWPLTLILAGWMWIAGNEGNDRCRAEAVLQALNIRIGVR